MPICFVHIFTWTIEVFVYDKNYMLKLLVLNGVVARFVVSINFIGIMLYKYLRSSTMNKTDVWFM